jgi:hypothetical protein
MDGSRQDTRDGLVIGLIAFASVALFYGSFDFLASRGALFTVNLLGGALFSGMRDPSVLQLPVPVQWAGIVKYSALHLVLSLLIGIVVVRMVGQAERTPAHARALTALIAAGFVATIAVVGWFSTPIRPLLPWWSIVLANSFAVLVGAAYLARVRPGVARRLLHPTAQGHASHERPITT